MYTAEYMAVIEKELPQTTSPQKEFHQLSPKGLTQRLVSTFLTHFDSKESEADILLGSLGEFGEALNSPGRFTIINGVVEINTFVDKRAWVEEFRRIRDRHEEESYDVRFVDNSLFGPYNKSHSSRAIHMEIQNGNLENMKNDTRIFLRFTTADRW